MKPDTDSTVITTPFGFHSTATDVIRGLTLTDKQAIVTGGASGIGRETARALASAGASVTLAVRDVDRAQPVAEQIRHESDNHAVHVVTLDLADLDSVFRFTSAWSGPLHILVNNAGVMALPNLTRTEDGHEMQFATNHLGHFALSLGLHEALAVEGGRIVVVSSSGHLASPVIFDDLHYRFRDYTPFGAYGQSKTANVLFAVEANARWAADGITANSLHPGGIATHLQRHVGGATYMQDAAQRFRRAGSAIKTLEQGAATTLLLATWPQLDGHGGRYFEDCNEARMVSSRDEGGLGGVAPYALNRTNAERLWEVSRQLIG